MNIANLPLPGGVAIILALRRLLACSALITAFGVTKIGIPSFIMTLAMMQIGDGICALLVRGQIAYSVPEPHHHAGLALDLRRALDRHRGRAGRCSSPISCSPTRASGATCTWSAATARRREYSGVNVELIVGAVMVISAVCSGMAGMLGVAYFGSAQQNEFDSYLLDAIAAVVVGGTSLFGGRGGIGNTIVGLFVLGVLNNGLDHVNIDSFLKILIRGLILLAALIINVYAERLRATDTAASH